MASRLASKLKGLELRPSGFDDPRLYPSRDLELELQASYFLFMCSIDHRTGARFRGVVEGEELRGSELLWRLGRLKLDEDPRFFTARSMAKVTAAEVASWLTVRWPRPAVVKGPGLRALLLRDAARWLIKLYGGYVTNLLERANDSCARLVELLRPFKAFNDPVAKKPFLLVKFLERRGIMRVADPENLEVPVDNHLTRIALRTGLIEAPGEALRPDLGLDVRLRMAVRVGFKRVCVEAGVKPTVLDDVLWSLGREVCTRRAARCEAKATIHGLGEVRGCPLRGACRGYVEAELRRLREPQVATWWY